MVSRVIRPADPGARVLHPCGRPLAAAGETVTWSAYWRRQQRDGAITAAEPPPPAQNKGAAHD